MSKKVDSINVKLDSVNCTVCIWIAYNDGSVSSNDIYCLDNDDPDTIFDSYKAIRDLQDRLNCYNILIY